MGSQVHGFMGVWIHGFKVLGSYSNRRAPLGCPKGALRVPVGFLKRLFGSWVHGSMGSWIHGCMGSWVHLLSWMESR